MIKKRDIKYIGRLIEFEGVDACGKTTCINKLKEYLESINKKVIVYDFPQYNTYIGQIISTYLRGEYGDINDIPQNIINILFASDRVSIQSELKEYLDKGYYVLLNRYTYSNIFQIARSNGNIEDLENLEFNILNILKPDDVVYITLPIEIIEKRINSREKREYQKGKEDIYESNKKLLIDTDEFYKKVAKDRKWHIINGYDKEELDIECIVNLIKKELNL